MTALASFSAPYIFGGGFRVMPTQIVFTRLNGEYGMAMVQTVALEPGGARGTLALEGSAGQTGTRGQKGTAPERRHIESPAARVAATVGGLGLRSAAPAASSHPCCCCPSCQSGPGPPNSSLPLTPRPTTPLCSASRSASARSSTASGWRAVRRWWLWQIALAAGLLVVRRRSPLGPALEAALGSSLGRSGTVFAIALATMFSVHAPLAGRVVLIGTVWLLPLAYLVRNLPISSRSILAGFRALDPSLDEAAASLGAGRWRTLWRVTLPLLRPAIAAGATLAFVTGLGDFVTSVVLYTYDTRPLSLEILSSLRQGDVGVAAAYGVLLMVLSAVVFVLGSGPAWRCRDDRAQDDSRDQAPLGADRGEFRGHDRVDARAPDPSLLRH